MNICDLINQHAIAAPEQIALIHGNKRISFLELARGVAQWARMLRNLNLKDGDRVGIAVKDTPDFVFGVLGAATAGVISIPIDWRASSADRDATAKQFDVDAILVERPSQGVGNLRSIPVDEAWSEAARQSYHLSPVEGADSPFMLNLSSGTTGLPKGAVVTHRDMVYRLGRHALTFGDVRNLRYLSVTPLCGAAGIYYCLVHLMLGNTVVLYPPLFSASEYVEAIKKFDIDFAFAVPTVLRWLLQLSNDDSRLLPGLKYLATGSAPFAVAEKRQVIKRICVNFVQTFATSAAGQIAALQPEDLDCYGESVGRPNLLTEVQIVDQDGQRVPAGLTGRIRCRGPGVSRRYYGNPDQSSFSEKIVDGWCYTGDLGRLEPNGFLYVEGRADDLIIRGGLNIQPAQVENVLLEYGGVREVAVVGRAHPYLGQEVVAYVILAPGATTGLVDAHCRTRLVPHLVPGEIFCVDALPKNTLGKVLKRELG